MPSGHLPLTWGAVCQVLMFSWPPGTGTIIPVPLLLHWDGGTLIPGNLWSWGFPR